MNHRDAWGFGAVDPSSGTTQLMEAARVIGEQVRGGHWRPKRTLVFASWASEEYGLLGSSEWVTDKMHKLMHRAVAGVNVDSCVSGGPIFNPQVSVHIIVFLIYIINLLFLGVSVSTIFAGRGHKESPGSYEFKSNLL